MKIVPVADAAARANEIVEALAAGGLACIPVRGAYRILADARSEAAITRLEQSKRRAHSRPALIVVSDLRAAREVVDGTAWPITQRLTEQLWPGPLTLLLPPSERLPAKVKKVLTRSTGTLGIRIPDDPLTTTVVRRFGGPLLVSSANLERKPGASSAATVRLRFERTVDVWVDAGDITSERPSTLVALTEQAWKLVREGAVPRDEIERALA
jgi:L-threonylcarbamoyladenylate synthase